MNKYIDAIQRILNPFMRELEPAAGDRGFCVGRVVDKGIDTAKRRVTATLSTPSIDRYGEVVLQTAFKDSLPRFMENPKFLAGHQSWSPDGSPTSIGRWVDMQINERGLIGTAEFLPAGDELADKWWFRFEHGAQRTFSVGFIAHKWEMREVDIDGAKKKVRHFTQAELLEVSAVELPANADAVLMTLGSVRDAGGDEAKLIERIIAAVEEREEKRFKKLLDELADPLGPIPVLINNALDDREARCGHSHHGKGDGESGKAPRDRETDEARNIVVEELKRKVR